MRPSFELDRPDHVTVGAVGAPGQRTFYLQAREADTLVTLKAEKEQVAALAQFLTGLLAKLPTITEAVPDETPLVEPIEPAWNIASLGIGYDEARDRILIEATEELEDDTEEEAATARFLVTRRQAAAIVSQANLLMKASRPVCTFCSLPRDPGGHVCPRTNGHIVR
jgi:uncharacterized repeat protein (TIGR03847 family)